jgi:hypothetical protein
MQELSALKRTLGRKFTARANLFAMLEEEGFDRNLFLQQMEEIGEAIHTLEAQINENEQKIASLEKIRANNREMIAFVKGNVKLLKGIADKITTLEPQQKQKLAESLVDGKIMVVGPPKPGDDEYLEDLDQSKSWMVNKPPFSFNIATLQALIDDGGFDKFYNPQFGPRGRTERGHRL